MNSLLYFLAMSLFIFSAFLSGTCSLVPPLHSLNDTFANNGNSFLLKTQKSLDIIPSMRKEIDNDSHCFNVGHTVLW